MHKQETLTRIRHRMRPFHRFRQDQNGLTLIELMIVLAILGLLTALAATFLWKTRQRAKEITLRHDLETFVLVQEAYFADANELAGSVGASIRNDGAASDFSVPPFLPSKNVVITIISGDPYDPYNEDDPLTIEARYQGTSLAMELNFKDQKIIEK